MVGIRLSISLPSFFPITAGHGDEWMELRDGMRGYLIAWFGLGFHDENITFTTESRFSFLSNLWALIIGSWDEERGKYGNGSREISYTRRSFQYEGLMVFTAFGRCSSNVCFLISGHGDTRVSCFASFFSHWC